MDLVGGYYDAGDNVKFGFPMAFTATMLSWSVIEFGGLMKGELGNAKEAIRWATDYLLKATSHPDIIYVQVSIVKALFAWVLRNVTSYKWVSKKILLFAVMGTGDVDFSFFAIRIFLIFLSK